jgi:riboflavin synthase
MFTGIIKSIGIITAIETQGLNKTFTIKSEWAPELKIDQSIAHNGVCLTIISTTESDYKVTAIAETLAKTNLNDLVINDLVNLESALVFNQALDGHIVQGHVDGIVIVKDIVDQDGSWEIEFLLAQEFAHLIIEKGSVTLNGISLTCWDVHLDSFKVAIIPYTYEHTNIHTWKIGSPINIEFDLIGKYLAQYMKVQAAGK